MGLVLSSVYPRRLTVRNYRRPRPSSECRVEMTILQGLIMTTMHARLSLPGVSSVSLTLFRFNARLTNGTPSQLCCICRRTNHVHEPVCHLFPSVVIIGLYGAPPHTCFPRHGLTLPVYGHSLRQSTRFVSIPGGTIARISLSPVIWQWHPASLSHRCVSGRRGAQ